MNTNLRSVEYFYKERIFENRDSAIAFLENENNKPSKYLDDKGFIEDMLYELKQASDFRMAHNWKFKNIRRI